MVNLTIDGKAVCVPEGTKILDAARQAGVSIPTLCYLEDLNEISACRVCVVEIEGSEKLVASCTTAVQEGMVVHTHSLRVLEARALNVSLILSQHNSSCTTCVRNKNCTLQQLAADFNIRKLPYKPTPAKLDWNSITNLNCTEKPAGNK